MKNHIEWEKERAVKDMLIDIDYAIEHYPHLSNLRYLKTEKLLSVPYGRENLVLSFDHPRYKELTHQRNVLVMIEPQPGPQRGGHKIFVNTASGVKPFPSIESALYAAQQKINDYLRVLRQLGIPLVAESHPNRPKPA